MAPSATTITEQYAPIILKKESLKLSRNGHDDDRHKKNVVQRTLKEHIAGIDPHDCDAGEEDAFFVADLGEVYRQHLRWKMNLKRVKPHYGGYYLPGSHERRLILGSC